MLNLVTAASVTLETQRKSVVSLFEREPVEEAYLSSIDSISETIVGNRRVIIIPVEKKLPVVAGRELSYRREKVHGKCGGNDVCRSPRVFTSFTTIKGYELNLT